MADAISSLRGFRAETESGNDDIHVHECSGKWRFGIFRTGEDWWAERLQGSDVELFATIADKLDCDLAGGSGELYGLRSDKFCVVSDAPQIPPPTLLERVPWSIAIPVVAFALLAIASRLMFG